MRGPFNYVSRGRTSIWFHPWRQLYRQQCFFAWHHRETEHGVMWEQKFCIKTVVTPSAQGRLSGLKGDSELGFNALDFMAPDKLSKKEVLEFLGRLLNIRLLPKLLQAWVQARSGATSLSSRGLRAAYGAGQATASISRGRHESACGDLLIRFFGGKRRSLSRALRSWLCSAAERPGFPPETLQSCSLFSMHMSPRHLGPQGLSLLSEPQAP